MTKKYSVSPEVDQNSRETAAAFIGGLLAPVVAFLGLSVVHFRDAYNTLVAEQEKKQPQAEKVEPPVEKKLVKEIEQ